MTENKKEGYFKRAIRGLLNVILIVGVAFTLPCIRGKAIIIQAWLLETYKDDMLSLAFAIGFIAGALAVGPLWSMGTAFLEKIWSKKDGGVIPLPTLPS